MQILTRSVANAVMEFVRFLNMLEGSFAEALYTVFVVVVAWLAGYIVEKITMFFMKKYSYVKHIGRIISPVIFLTLIPFAFPVDSDLLYWMTAAGRIYLIICVVIALNSLLGFAWHTYDSRRNQSNHPLKGLLQVATGILWLIGVILCGAVLVNKSPLALLTGLGALSAVLMLVFKDSILGFVAGIQLSVNDTLRVGDWIAVKNSVANGVVEDVSLTVVRVRNFDNTVVLLPPYSLVSTSFQNYRGMQDSGVRRIAMNVNVDVSSICDLTLQMIENLSDLPEISDFIRIKKEQKEKGIEENTSNSAGIENGTIDTNLGLFRAYFTTYLKQHRDISHRSEDIVMLIPGEPEPAGLPVQIYCFSATTDWVAYEGICAEILEHFVVSMEKFGLRPFGNPSGYDISKLGTAAVS